MTHTTTATRTAFAELRFDEFDLVCAGAKEEAIEFPAGEEKPSKRLQRQARPNLELNGGTAPKAIILIDQGL